MLFRVHYVMILIEIEEVTELCCFVNHAMLFFRMDISALSAENERFAM